MMNLLSDNMAKESDSSLASLMNRVVSNLERYEKGQYIMTDDKAPVELLGMKVIDEMIQDEVSNYKEIYEEGGIKAILDALQ